MVFGNYMYIYFWWESIRVFFFDVDGNWYEGNFFGDNILYYRLICIGEYIS